MSSQKLPLNWFFSERLLSLPVKKDGIQTLHFAATHALETGFHSLAGLKLIEILSWPCS